MAESAAADPYATGKANLRDTIKWLTTTFAAIAAAILAGSPLTGLGALPLGLRLVAACVGAMVGLGCLLGAIGKTLSLLRSEAFFLEELRTNERLRKFVDGHRRDILPPQYSKAEEFLDARERTIDEINVTARDPARVDNRAAVARFVAMDQVAGRLVNLLHFEVLSERLKDATPTLTKLAIGAIVGLGVFAWAANPPKAADADKKERFAGVGPEYLGGVEKFHPGESLIQPSAFESNDDYLKAQLVLESVCTRWRERKAAGYEGLLLVIGGTDRLPLAGSSKARFEANTGLAQARAESTKNALLNRCPSPTALPGREQSADKIVVLVSGPRNTPTVPTLGGYPQDRRVDIWALWGTVATAQR